MYGTASSSDPRLTTILYDDYGRVHTFEFELPRGLYDVTVSVGWNGKTYKNNTIYLNGEILFLDVETNATVSYINRTMQVYCYANKLFMEIGDSKDYTMLNYLIIKLNTTNIGFNYFSNVNKTLINTNSSNVVPTNNTNNNNKTGNTGSPSLVSSIAWNVILVAFIILSDSFLNKF